MRNTLNKLFYLCLILITITGAFYIFYHFSKTEKTETIIQNYTLLDSCFTKKQYTLSLIKKEKLVPRIFVKNISPSIKHLNISERKSVFIRIILSNVLKANETLLQKRTKILNLKEKKQLNKKEQKWLDNWSEKLRVKNHSFSELLIKTDIIPPSLAIIQSIIESGYGTSRFAIEGNSLFGEHFYGKNPENHLKANNSKTRLKSYSSIYDAIWGYMINLNRHPAYKKLRELRAKERKDKKTISGYQLINTLKAYSQNGNSYTNKLHNMMRQLQLTKLDSLQLETSLKEYYCTIKE